MERDEQLKKILSNGTEIASADFTDAIMKRINTVTTNAFHFKPLVSDRLKKIFLCTFAILVLLILLLCLVIGSDGLPLLSLIKIPHLSWNIYYEIFAFIFLFWIVFTANYFIQKIK